MKQTVWKTWLDTLWPIEKSELPKFLGLTLIGMIITIDYHFLKNLKDTVIVTHPSMGAGMVPFIKMWMLLPASIFLAWLYATLSKRFTQTTVFQVMVLLFIGYLLAFNFVLYPYCAYFTCDTLSEGLKTLLPQGLFRIAIMLKYWHLSLFFIFSELWGSLILLVLFWGYCNRSLELQEAKRFYGPIIFFGNISGVISSQLMLFFSHPLFYSGGEEGLWFGSFKVKILYVVLTSLIALAILRWVDPLLNGTNQKAAEPEIPGETLGFFKSVKELFQSTQYTTLALLVLCFYFTFGVMEVVWLAKLRLLHPDPTAFSNYLNYVNTAIGIISTLLAFVVIGNVLQNWSWYASALITPCVLLIAFLAFFCTHYMGVTNLETLVLIGATYFCLARVMKFTFFDTTKELAFVNLPREAQIKGKATIDGIMHNVGKTGESLFLNCTLAVFYSLEGAMLFLFGTLLSTKLLWIFSTVQCAKARDSLRETELAKKPLT